jgi:quercetin dioxygenase-like cupin family protein
MALYVAAKDVPDGKVEMKVVGGKLSTKQVIGTDSSLMVASRSGGYHSKPHVHNCEQLNYLVEGEIWLFVEKEVFHLKAGDFLRIPPNAVHWAWNRSDEDCVLFESHAPPLDILPRDQTPILLTEDEDPRAVRWVKNIFVSEEYMEVEKELLD